MLILVVFLDFTEGYGKQEDPVQLRVTKQEEKGEAYYSLSSLIANWDTGTSNLNHLNLEYGLSDYWDFNFSWAFWSQYWLLGEPYNSNSGNVNIGTSYKFSPMIENSHLLIGGYLDAPAGTLGVQTTFNDLEYVTYSNISFELKQFFGALILLSPSIRFSNINETQDRAELLGNQEGSNTKLTLKEKSILASIYFSMEKIGLILDMYWSKGILNEKVFTPFIFYTPSERVQLTISRPFDLNSKKEINLIIFDISYHLNVLNKQSN